MAAGFLLERFGRNAARDAVVWHGRAWSYGRLLEMTEDWRRRLDAASLQAGSVVSIEADFSPNAVALLLALVERRCIVVPLTRSVEGKKPEFRDIAAVERIVSIGEGDEAAIESWPATGTPPLIETLKREGRPGLVLFSSGSSGKSKAAVHDFTAILEKFKVPRPAFRTIAFLLFDHIGGLNTLLHTLSNGGCVVTVRERSPEAVCEAIERHRVELLPTSPTFINLLLLSRAYERYDLSSLRVVTYGTEVMPESTLAAFRRRFPSVDLQQTYGLSEIGIMRTKSKSPDSLWMKVGGEGYETRIVDGMLEVRARSAMRGYLNAPSPFTEDGWFRTGDAVETDGEYIRILGRASELINVGGEKVYPAEVESVLQTMDGVADVAVTGEANPIMGQIVKARVRIVTGESLGEFRTRMYRFCRGKLAKYKIPQKVEFASAGFHGGRFKKMRRETAETEGGRGP